MPVYGKVVGISEAEIEVEATSSEFHTDQDLEARARSRSPRSAVSLLRRPDAARPHPNYELSPPGRVLICKNEDCQSKIWRRCIYHIRQGGVSVPKQIFICVNCNGADVNADNEVQVCDVLE